VSDWKKDDRVVVRTGYERAGRTGTVLGPPLPRDGQVSWTPVLWDDEVDPDWFKTVALAPEAKTKEQCVTIMVRTQLGFMDTVTKLLEAARKTFPGPVEISGVNLEKREAEHAKVVDERNAAVAEAHRLRCERVSLDERVTLADHEREAIREALFLTHGNRKKASARLGIGERTLYRKIEEYGLQDVGAEP